MFYQEPKGEDYLSLAKNIQANPHEILFFAFGEETEIDLSAFIKILTDRKVIFFGGTFPGIISGTQSHTKGCIVKRIQSKGEPYVIKEISKKEYKIPEMESGSSMLLFLDGLTSGIGHCLSEVYNTFGNSVKFIGGGAGSLSLEQKPCLFTKDGVFQDAAILCPSEMDLGLGVKHGWKKIAGPFVATKTEANTVKELNWQNAFEVYKSYVDQDSGKNIDSENFFSIAKGYPFGIYKEGTEEIIRDPLLVNDAGELVCVGEVPENAVLHIMKGEAENLISSASDAAGYSLQGIQGKPDEILIIDCISRTLFLEDGFPKELEAARKPLKLANEEIESEGILSLGEISSYGNNLLEFFNKTMVVGTLCRKA